MIRTYKPRHELAPYAGGMTLQKADLSSKILATLVPAATCSESSRATRFHRALGTEPQPMLALCATIPETHWRTVRRVCSPAM